MMEEEYCDRSLSGRKIMVTGPKRASVLCVCLIATFSISAPVCGQEFFERFGDWPRYCSIEGTIIVSDSVATLMANGVQTRDGRVGPFPAKFRSAVILGADAEALALQEGLKTRFDRVDRFALIGELELLPADTVLLWCEPRGIADISASECTAISKIARDHLSAGGVFCAVGMVAEAIGKCTSIKSDAGWTLDPSGMNLFPDSWIIFSEAVDAADALRNATFVPRDPAQRCVAVALERGNVLVLSGRKVRLLGSGSATISLAASEHLPAKTHRLRERDRADNSEASSGLVDWTQWRREAIERTLEPFPPSYATSPSLANGTLVIVGGGGMPRGLMRQFVDFAGGKDAELVYVPCLETEDVGQEARMLDAWKEMGVKRCSMLHTKDRGRANEDATFLEPLQSATGIWFGGGRQWNFADSYYGTESHRLMKQVLQRGGVIGGSSAGASIQADYLARATPIGNRDIIAPGYERGGLGFLRGVAIDQHFSQRNRQQDLRTLVQTYPQLMGIGIDEATALIVRDATAEVVGQGQVYVYSAHPQTQSCQEEVYSHGANVSLSKRGR
jgi:cyanophycinase